VTSGGCASTVGSGSHRISAPQVGHRLVDPGAAVGTDEFLVGLTGHREVQQGFDAAADAARRLGSAANVLLAVGVEQR
jgi:hypothetical protein